MRIYLSGHSDLRWGVHHCSYLLEGRFVEHVRLSVGWLSLILHRTVRVVDKTSARVPDMFNTGADYERGVAVGRQIEANIRYADEVT